MIKTFFASLVIMGVLDYLWLGVIARNFNTQQLLEIARIENGQIVPLKIPALVTYLVMALALTVFAAPHNAQGSLPKSLLYGALLGFTLYAVYDLTNLAVLKNYPVKFALLDIAWGTCLFAISNMTLLFSRRWLT